MILIPTESTQTKLANTHSTLLHRVRKFLNVIMLIIMVYIIISVTTFRVMVDGRSMETTLTTGQFLLVSRLHYQFSTPQRGDIIVFQLASVSEYGTIKRIIGLPRDTIEFREGWVYINGVLLAEPYLAEPCLPTICPNSIWQMGADEYFVMGDNRNQSRDSRSFGAIPADAINGKAIIRYWPLTEVNWLH